VEFYEPVIPAEAGIQQIKKSAQRTRRAACGEFRKTATPKMLSGYAGDA
jgi:hypothetical protein